MKWRVHIRPPTADDMPSFLAAAQTSIALHQPWVTAPHSPASYHAYLERMSQPENRAFLVCTQADGALVGVVNVTQIVMGSFCSAFLGYYAFAGHERQGLMTEGLKAVVKHAFRTLKLHRLEANIQPSNEASMRLVKACGFVKEGFSARYLKIGGRWRDHERWAVVSA